MRIWLIIKIAAGLIVVAIATFTGMLSYHIAVKPISGPLGVVFAKIIPEAGMVLRDTKEEDFSKVLDAAEIPDFEPGDRAFRVSRSSNIFGFRFWRETHGGCFRQLADANRLAAGKHHRFRGYPVKGHRTAD